MMNRNIPEWLQKESQRFPSCYGQHALDDNGHILTMRDPGEYVGAHRNAGWDDDVIDESTLAPFPFGRGYDIATY